MPIHSSLAKGALGVLGGDEDKKKKKKGSTIAKGALEGVAKAAATDVAKSGAKKAVATTIGSVLGGPVGGALVTAGAGLIDANRADKATDPNRPKRRRMTKAFEGAQEVKKTKERALATLSQAVFDWASAIR